MSMPAEQVLDIVHRAFAIAPTADGAIVTHVVGRVFEKTFVSYADFAKLDRRLPVVIPAILAFMRHTNRHCDDFMGKLLLATLDLWQKPQFLMNGDGNWHAYTEMHWVNVEDYRPGDRTISAGCHFLIRSTEVMADGTSVEFVTDTPAAEPAISTHWLDTQYPGWERRLLVAQALGYEDTELVNAIFMTEIGTRVPVELGALCDADENTPKG